MLRPVANAVILSIVVAGCGSRRDRAGAQRDAAVAVPPVAIDAAAGPEILGVGAAGTGVGGLVAAGDTVVWLAGGSVEYVALAARTQRHVATQQVPVGDLALDDGGPLWVNRDDGAVMVGSIDAAATALAKLAGAPCAGLASDGTTIYANGCKGIVALPRAGGPLRNLADTDDTIGPLALGDDAVVFVAKGNQLAVVPRAGGARRTLGAPAAGAIAALVVAGDRAYWTAPPATSVFSIALDGHEAEAKVALAAPCPPAGLALAADRLYVTCPTTGAVVRAGRDGTAIETVATGEDRPTAIGVSARGPVWIAAGSGQLRGLAR